MDNKIYVEKITEEFCDIVRQLYIDKETDNALRPLDEEAKNEFFKKLESFDNRMIDISGFINDMFSSALNNGGIHLDFNDLFYNYDSSLAMDIYTTLLECAKIDMTDLLQGGLSITMIGNNRRTNIGVSRGFESVVCRKIENKDLTNDDTMVR